MSLNFEPGVSLTNTPFKLIAQYWFVTGMVSSGTNYFSFDHNALTAHDALPIPGMSIIELIFIHY